MSKIFKFILFLTICFFGFEAYRVFTHSHPMLKKIEEDKNETNSYSKLNTTTPESSPSNQSPENSQDTNSDQTTEDMENLGEILTPPEETSPTKKESTQETSQEKSSGPIIFVKNPIKSPKLTIIFYAEGIGKSTLDNLSPYLKGGFDYIRSKGNCYENAFFPIPNSSAAQEIGCFTTGSFAATHGLVNHLWIDSQNNLFGSVQDDNTKESAVFNPSNGNLINIDETPSIFTKFYKSGISPKNYKVEGISDLLVQNPKQDTNVQVISIGSTPQTATLMANFHGKAFWMDPVTGLFTTSKYFFPNNIPDWVQNYNTSHTLPETFVWQSANPMSNKAYLITKSKNLNNNPFAKSSQSTSLVGSVITSQNPDVGSLIYNMGPKGVETLFDFANQTISNWIENTPEDQLVLWINHSGYNTFAATLGSKSLEAIDILYHIDEGLKKVLDFATSKITPENCLFLFIGNEKNYDIECKDSAKNPSLVESLNQFLGNDYVQEIITPYVYMNRKTFGELKCLEQRKILQNVKNFLKTQPSIQNAWTFEELQTSSFDSLDTARFTKLSNFQNVPSIIAPQERRSGEVVFQIVPTICNQLQLSQEINDRLFFDPISSAPCSNKAALYIYMPNQIEGKSIYEPVLMNQVPVTLAEIFNIPRPFSAPIETPLLPQIFH